MRDDVPLPPSQNLYVSPLRTPLWRVPPLCGYAALRTLPTLPRPRSDASRLVSRFEAPSFLGTPPSSECKLPPGQFACLRSVVSLLETHSFPIVRFFSPSFRPSMSESIFALRRALSRKKIPNVSRFDTLSDATDLSMQLPFDLSNRHYILEMS